MADRVTVRDGRPGDGARLAELLAGGALTVQEGDDPAPYEDALAEIGRTAGTTVLVAEVDGRVVGLCQLITFRHLQHQGGRCAEIESVHVDATYRSQGVGARLIGAAVERARQAGCYRVQLTSNVARPDAHRFWAREGFEPTHVGFKRYL